MKKKFLCLFLVLVMVGTTLAGCGKTEEEEHVASLLDYTASDYVTLGDYLSMEVTLTEKYEVTEEELLEYLDYVLSYYTYYNVLDKTVVETGDLVNIDYEGYMDGEQFSGGTATDQILEIGSGSYIDGFEDGLIGYSVGDTVTLDLNFPDPYTVNTDYSGAAVTFVVTINSIVEEATMTYEQLTDDFVMTNLGYTSVEEYYAAAEESLISTYEYYNTSNIQSAVLELLAEICTVNSLPEEELASQVAEYIESYATMIETYYGYTLSELLSLYSMTEEDFEADVEDMLRENMETEFILFAIAEAEGIGVDEEGYAAYIAEVLESYGYDDEDALYEDYDKGYVMESYVCNTVLDMLLEIVTVTYDLSEETAEEE